MKRKIATVLCMIMLSIPLCGYGDPKTNAQTLENSTLNEENEELLSADGHLPDYTEMYGLEPALPTDGTKMIGLDRQMFGARQMQQTFQYIAVFIEFPDMEDYHLDTQDCVANAEKYFNASEGTATAVNGSGVTVPVTSLKNYIEKYSYGKCSVDVSIFPENENGNVVSYMSSHPRSYYLEYDAENNTDGYQGITQQNQREMELINEVVAGVKGQILSQYDISQLDMNRDGIMDAISFFVESEEQGAAPIAWSDLLWSHKLSGAGISVVDGLLVDTYNLINCYDYTQRGGMFSSIRPAYGTIIHEYIHTLGFPDLYRYYASGEPVGLYDLMATTDKITPQGLLTYMISEHNSVGWHNALNEITSSTEGITLKKAEYTDPSESCAIKIRSPLNENEFFVVEYFSARENTYVTPDRNGLIVYRVNNEYEDNGNQLGGYHGEQDYIYIFREGDSSANEGNIDNMSLQKATLNLSRPEKGKTLGSESAAFDPDTLYFTDGTNSGICLKVTSETDDTITFDVTVSNVEGTGTENDPYLINTARDFISILKVNPGRYYRITADLDFSEIRDYTGFDFEGNLDGDGHTIKNVTAEGTGLFNGIGISSQSTVRNLCLENISAKGNGDYTGAFASVIQNASIQNVVVSSGTVTNCTGMNSLTSTGGFAGNASSEAVIEDCYSNANVQSGPNVGGFIGMNQSALIQNCFASGSLSNGNDESCGNVLGGFIGLQYNMNSTYTVPVNTYYNVNSTQTEKMVGAKDNADHTSTNDGIIGVSAPDEIKLVESKSAAYKITTVPAGKSVSYSVTSRDSGVVTYNNDSGQITGKSVGSAVLETVIPVGSHRMILTTNVTVEEEDVKEEALPSVYYSTHVQNYGWQTYRKDGQMSGTSGQSKRLEAIKIYLSGSNYSGGIEYCTHVQTYGWQSYKCDNAMSGTSGQSKRLEAIRIRLTGELAQHYDVYYRVHAQTFGWLGWAKNGESAGSQGYAKRLEGIEIMLVKKGNAAPGTTENAFRSTKISYRTHVQSYGWQSYVYDGSSSGTIGQSKRLEAIQIKKANNECSGSIEYRTHIQTYGWENTWKCDGQISGTSGQSKRLEAIQIRLTGEMGEKYDVYYRVHAQTYGWLGWAKNGEEAGTQGQAKRLEAIEIVLVEKGGKTPVSNIRPFVK
ncbi:MAG: hypothetical protein Q4B75_00250 [Eubacteriales bacterium]|nr:hypothetical protein [Eubacteriales bacterium]